jgi:4-alpha-glucanotransferase
MSTDRAAGVLAHPTSLPGRLGLGDLGPTTLRFLDWAAEAGVRLWQVLPLGPTGAGQSPYSALSSFAGNPLLVSPVPLVDAGWLHPRDVEPAPLFRDRSVDFARVAPWRSKLLRRAWSGHVRRAGIEQRRALEAFVEHSDQRSWLEDWALFAALRRRFRRSAWNRWPEALRGRSPRALADAREQERDEIAFQRFVQFLFFSQWSAVRGAAAIRGIELLGDLPFYPAGDSVDVWSRPELFHLGPGGSPTRVAGVPPDYFSRTGQRWGNPIYRWDRLAADGYAWWIERLRASLRLANRVRLDHFRGFVAHWEVDAAEKTAAAGHWSPGPGEALFRALRESLGALPLVAEDLGEITEDVDRLRDALGLPGMRVLQFGFDGGDNRHHPEAVPESAVVFTGTHDNDTTLGWFRKLDASRRRSLLGELGATPSTVVWRLIETAYASPAAQCVIPLQDLFGLGSSARLNRPGKSRGNWRWRAVPRQFTLERAARLRALADETRRI